MADPNGHSWRDGMSSDNIKGLILALSSSIFIGSSFIVKKKGLKKAGASGVRAGISIIEFFRDLFYNVPKSVSCVIHFCLVYIFAHLRL